VLLVSIGITLITGVLFSLAPVWQSRRVEVNEALKEGSRGTASLSKLRIGRLLVVFQVALSILLLVGTGLCVKTFANLKNKPLGFRPEGVLLFSMDPSTVRYPADRVGALFTELQEHLNAIPGVQSATFSGTRRGTGVDTGKASPDGTIKTDAPAVDVGSRFFETMGIPILYGRAVDGRDAMGSAVNQVVVSQEFARRYFQDENPVGRTFKGSDKVTYQIVGVCADWRFENLRDAVPPTFYSAFVQAPRAGRIDFEVKIAGGEAGVVAQIRQAVRSVDANLAIADVRTEVQQIENGLSQERLMASLAAVFGGLALILAAIGIYGVMAYAVARRTNEIGIRVTLGARPAGVAWMVLRETLALAAAGVALAIPAVLSLSPVLDHVLAPAWRDTFAYGMKANDPANVAAAVLVLAIAGVLAGYLPARRAARVDPMTALRHD
jgi:predicted permease